MLTSHFRKVSSIASKRIRPVTYNINNISRLLKRDINVAIVGSGPAGYYALDELLKLNITSLNAHIFDKSPNPFGLVRSGVAPDHPEVKAVESQFTELSKRDNVEFFGNVHVGKDITVEELMKMYNVVVFAYGACKDRKLGISGEDLKGVHSARYVSYNQKSSGFIMLLKRLCRMV